MPIISEDAGGGGASGFNGAAVRLAGGHALGDNVVVPFDTVDVDTGGYFDAVNSQWLIPAGKAGRYRYGVWLVAAKGTSTSAIFEVTASGNMLSFEVPGISNAVLTEWDGNGWANGLFAVGDTIQVGSRVFGAASLNVTGGFNGCWLFLEALGA